MIIIDPTRISLIFAMVLSLLLLLFDSTGQMINRWTDKWTNIHVLIYKCLSLLVVVDLNLFYLPTFPLLVEVVQQLLRQHTDHLTSLDLI